MLRTLVRNRPALSIRPPIGRAQQAAVKTIQRRWMAEMPQPEMFAKKNSRLGPITWTSLGLMLATGAGLVSYFLNERQKQMSKLPPLDTRQIGKPKLGGPFELLDHNGKTRTDKDFVGKFMLIYFGFTFCPDICPEELTKMVEVVDALDKTPGIAPGSVQPVFISVDPKRDTPEVIRDYLKDFSPKIVGLTGADKPSIAKVAKAYRVYFSADDSNPTSADYLVDHSVFFYLIDPQGQFVEVYYSQTKTSPEITAAVLKQMKNWTPSKE